MSDAMPIPKTDWLKTLTVAFVGICLLCAFLSEAIPLAVQCWDKDHAHYPCPPTHRSDSPKRAG